MNEGIVRSIDGFVAVSSYTRDLVRIHLPQLNHVPVEVIPNPVTVPAFAPKHNQDGRGRTILYASGSEIGKGPHIALYAVRKLLDEYSKEFTLTMLGTEDNGWIKSIVKRLGIERHVKLQRRLPRAQVFALMADSTVVLLPSLWLEALPTVPIEANLLGTPAIVSNRGGSPDTIVDKVTGLVTEPSVEAVAKALNEALELEWNREKIARITKERFNPERIIDDFTRFLETFV
jgi:glycosyltransferase involved in cell wall biosynthesis